MATSSLSTASSSSKTPLWKLMLELGNASCEPSTLKDLYTHLQHSNPSYVLRETDVAQAIGMMMCYPFPPSASATPKKTQPDLSSLITTANNTSAGSCWDVESFVSVIKELCPKIDWAVVVKDLDYAEFFLKEAKGFELLLRAYKRAVSDFMSFPIKHLINPWKNLPGQLSLLKQAISFPPDYFSFSIFPCRRIFTPEDLSSCTIPASYKIALNALFQQTWNCLDLLEYLISLFDTEYHDMVRPLLEQATRESPELFCLGLASFSNWSNISLRDTLIKLVCGFLMGHSNCAIVIPKLWSINPNILLACMVDLYRKDPSCLSRILDVSQELKILSLILDSKPSSFSLDIAALASRREHLNLEKWITDNVTFKRDAFAKPCLDFLKEKMRLMIERQEGKFSVPFIPLSSEVLSIFIHSIMSCSQDLSPECNELCRDLQSVLMGSSQSHYSQQPSPHSQQAPPPLPPTSQTHSPHYSLQQAPSSTSEARGLPVQQPEINFPTDVEEEVNSYYERIYRHEFEVKDIIELFTTLKTSKNPRDQQVFACMIHNLFDEYQYFHGYPEKELALTATIFGILIQYQLISHVPLVIALRCVMDALKKPSSSKLFKFGLQSLIQFRSRLVEWPQYCSHLLQIPHFSQIQPELASYLKQCLLSASQSFSNAGSSLYFNTTHSAPSLPAESNISVKNEDDQIALSSSLLKTQSKNTFTSTGEGSFTSVNINVLLDAVSARELSYETPDSPFQEKVSFIINNISSSNFSEKLAELVDLFNGSNCKYFNWFSTYLVIKRASIEPNFHEIYIKLLEQFQPKKNSKILLMFVYEESLFSVKTLISSEKTLSSSSDRTLLKNLGIWLGSLTLARNQPILQDDLCFKTLLVSGYEEDKLIVVIPFVCKILDQSVRSIAFQPNNPWLMCILKILSELYHKIDLKLTLKFEIELLYKHLHLELNQMEMTSLFKNRSIKKRSIPSLQTPEKKEADKFFTDSSQPLQPTSLSLQQSGIVVPSPFSPRMPSTDDKHLGIPALVSYIAFPTEISSNSSICKLILFAFDFAIREVAPTVIKRAINISSATVNLLIAKDFLSFRNDCSSDSFDELVSTSRSSIAQNIVGNLTLITCRESLRNAILTNINNFLKLSHLENTISSQILTGIVDNNLDLCCAFVERSAIDQSVKLCENSSISSSLFTEMNDKKLSVATPSNSLSINIDNANEVSKVYEDFARVSRISHLSTLPLPTPLPSISVADQENLLSFLKSIQKPEPPSSIERTTSILTVQQCMDSFSVVFSQIEKHLSSSSTLSLTGINHLLQQIIQLPLSSPNHKDEICMLFLHKIVQFMYKNNKAPESTHSSLSIDACIYLVKHLSSLSVKSGKEVVTWFIYSDDLRKLDLQVNTSILLSTLIPIPEYDMQLVRQLESEHPQSSASLVEFSLNVMKYVVDSESKSKENDLSNQTDVLRMTDFVTLFEYLSSTHPQHEIVKQALALKRTLCSELKNQVSFFFADWMRLCLYPSNDALIVAFVKQLFSQTFRNSNYENIQAFITYLVESAFICWRRQALVPMSSCYFPLDSLATLVVSIIRYYQPLPESSGITKSSHLFGSILESIGVFALNSLNVNFTEDSSAEQKGSTLNSSNPLFDSNAKNEPTYIKPLTRLLIQICNELNAIENDSTEIFATFCSFLMEIQPLNLTCFCYGWLEIVSCKWFMPVCLKDTKLWSSYYALLKAWFTFYLKHLSSVDNASFNSTLFTYKGILRFLLVLLHDFSDFLSFYACDLCDVIPLHCIQFRNLVLSAFPQSLKLLDPFTTALHIDSPTESSSPPNSSSDWRQNISPVIQLVADCKEEDIKSMSDLVKQHLSSTALSLHSRFTKVNCLVQFCGSLHLTSSKKSVFAKLITQLVIDSDVELRYLLLVSIVNQLRYPNLLTTWYSKLTVDLFDLSNANIPSAAQASSKSYEIISEQVVRVLLERLVVNRPHPWGLLVTFVELIKNPAHSFWNKSFIKIAPEIERLFSSVARTCMSG